MDWKSQLKDLWSRATWSSTAAFALPSVLFELQPDFLLGARLTGKTNGGGRGQVGRLALQPLEPGTLQASPSGPAILNESVLGSALEQVGAAVGNGQSRVGILVPDGTVRVGVFPFETLPSKRREAATLVGWKMRDSLPFPPEEARITYQSAPPSAGSLEIMALAARASVLAEFEELLEGLNRSSAMILPATVALLPLIPAEVPGEEEAGQLLIHACSNSATLAVVAGQRLRFWRTRDLEDLKVEEWFSQVAADAARVVASSEDRLALHLGRVWLCARPPATEDWAQGLAQALGREVELLRPDMDLGGLLAGEERSWFERYGAPLAGLLANH